MVKFYEKGKNVQLSKNFNTYEFDCNCHNGDCGWTTIHPNLVFALEELRKSCGNKPLAITSGMRCQRHNSAVFGVKNSKHLIGHAVDILLPNDILIEDFYYRARNLQSSNFDIVIAYDIKSFIHCHINPQGGDHGKRY